MIHIRTGGVVLAAVAALALSSCSATGTAGAPGGSSSSSAASTPHALQLTDAQRTLALSLSAGKAGKADPSKKPVQVGFINVDGGTPSFPEATSAAKVAVELVNDELGGIDGHPLELVQCDVVQGDADAQKCAQQFVNDSSIQAVVLGMTVLGTGPIYSTIGEKKSVLGIGTFNPVDLNQAGVNYVEGAGFVTGPGVVQYSHDYLKAKTLALAYDGTDPGAAAAAQVIAKLGPKYGVKVKSVPVSDSSQWSTALVSAGAQTADAVALSMGTAACVPAAQAVTSSGVTAPVLTFGFCQDGSVAKSLGDYPKWTYLQPNKSPIGIKDPDVELYNAIMDAYAPQANRAGGAAGTFQALLAQVHALNTVGYDKLSVTAIRDAVHAYTGPLFMGPSAIKCGQYAADKAESLCDASVFPATYKGDGKWSDPTGGKGIDTAGVGFK